MIKKNCLELSLTMHTHVYFISPKPRFIIEANRKLQYYTGCCLKVNYMNACKYPQDLARSMLHHNTTIIRMLYKTQIPHSIYVLRHLLQLFRITSRLCLTYSVLPEFRLPSSPFIYIRSYCYYNIRICI